MRTEVQAVAWRSYWPVALLAVTFLLVVGIFGAYLTNRQRIADDRAERQRQAICAILANIPGHIPPEIVKARAVFARANHPGDCQPVVRLPVKPHPTPAPTVAVTPSPRETVVIVRPAPTSSSSPRPSPSRTSPSPAPKPSPSRTCVLIVCT